MRNFLKCFSVYLTAVMVLLGTVLFPAVGASAAGRSVVMELESELVGSEGWFDPDFVFVEGFSGSPLYLFSLSEFDLAHYPAGTYIIKASAPGFSSTGFIWIEDSSDGSLVRHIPSGLANEYEIVIEEGQFFIIQGYDGVVVEYCAGGLYYDAFDMFAKFIYGDFVELTTEQNMVLTILATLAVLFVVVVPFLVVYFVIRLLFVR